MRVRVFSLTVLLVSLLSAGVTSASPQLIWELEEVLDGQGLAIFPREDGGHVIVGQDISDPHWTNWHTPLFHLFDADGTFHATVYDASGDDNEVVGVAQLDDGRIVLGCECREDFYEGPVFLKIREYSTNGQLLDTHGYPDVLDGHLVQGFERRADGGYVALLENDGFWLLLVDADGEVVTLLPCPDFYSNETLGLLRDGRVVLAGDLTGFSENPRIYWTEPWSLEFTSTIVPDWPFAGWRIRGIIPMSDSRFGVIVSQSYWLGEEILYVVDTESGMHGTQPFQGEDLRGGREVPGGSMLFTGADHYKDEAQLWQVNSRGDLIWHHRHHEYVWFGVSMWFRGLTLTPQNELLAVGSGYIDWGIDWQYWVYGARYTDALPPTPPSLELLPHFVNPDLPDEGGSFPFTIWIDAVYPAGHRKTLTVNLENPDGISERVLSEELTLPPVSSERVGPWEVVLDADDPPGEYWIHATLDSAGVTLAGDSYRLRKQMDNPVHDADAADQKRPGAFTLHPVAPNPCNAAARVTVTLPVAAELNVTVFNVAGRVVATLADGSYSAGRHGFTFEGSTLTSGVYFVRAAVPGRLDEVRKLMLIR